MKVLYSASTAVGTFVKGETVTVSAYLKGYDIGSSPRVRFTVFERNAAGTYLREGNSSAINITSEFARYSYSYTTTNANCSRISVLIEASNINNYELVDLTVACVQAEKKSSATSFIPTIASTLTRNKETYVIGYGGDIEIDSPLVFTNTLAVNGGDITSTGDLTIDPAGSDLLLDATGPNYAADGGANDDYAITLTGITIKTGMVIYFKANTANTGACTLNINGVGAVSLKSFHDQDPPDNYIEAGSMVQVIYDGTNYQILSPDANP